MNANNLQVLSILLERAESERDEGRKQMQVAQAQASQARAQHSDLALYRSEYQQRWGQQFADRGTMDIVVCYQNFGGRLDQAISSQTQVAQYADQRLEQARARLQELEMRVTSIAKLMERRRLEISRAGQRQEQKATDEQAARASLNAFNPFVRLSA